jgi:hypothetical protein
MKFMKIMKVIQLMPGNKTISITTGEIDNMNWGSKVTIQLDASNAESSPLKIFSLLDENEYAELEVIQEIAGERNAYGLVCTLGEVELMDEMCLELLHETDSESDKVANFSLNFCTWDKAMSEELIAA